MARHRIGGINNGLGNPEKAVLDNTGKINKQFADAAIEVYFQKWEGFDFKVDKDLVAVGIEPTYQGDPLKIVTIRRDKSQSTIQEGKAFGYYGSGVRQATRVYANFKYNSKFKRFVDQWHPILFPETLTERAQKTFGNLPKADDNGY